MHNLLRFIKINHFILLFILIEGFSIYLLIGHNSYHSSAAVKFGIKHTSFIYDYTSSLSKYMQLKETNEHLINENAKLQNLLKNETSFSDSTLIRNNKYYYYPARVINNSVDNRNNFITINKGRKHGIKEGMGVITKKGVIGIIYAISNKYSIAISLLHRKSAISIKVKKNHHNGILKWHGFNYRFASIKNFPAHIPINIGDTITTNSHSVIFPEGINIGTISNITKNKKDGFFDVKVNLFEDFNQLNYVYIIHSKESNEQIELEKKAYKNE